MMALVRGLLQDRPTGVSDAPLRRRKLSFASLISAEPDLAERNEEVLRNVVGYRRPPALCDDDVTVGAYYVPVSVKNRQWRYH